MQDGGYRGQTRKASVSRPVQSFHELSFTDLKKIIILEVVTSQNPMKMTDRKKILH